MTIQYTDFSRAPILESPAKNLFENILRGYQMAKEPEKMQEEQTARKLANQFRQGEVAHQAKGYELGDKEKEYANALKEEALKYLPKERAMKENLINARINRLNTPAASKDKLLNLYDIAHPNSTPEERSEFADKAVNAQITNLTRGAYNQGAPAGQQIEIQLPNGEKGIISDYGKNKQGDQTVTDKNGKIVGYNVRLDNDAIKQWKGKTKFDVVYPFMSDAFSYYTGEGSWLRFKNDVDKYSVDQEAKQRIDDYFASKDLLSVAKTTENARILGHATNKQLEDLRVALDSSEVHKKLQQGSSIQLPAGYKAHSNKIFKKYLDQMEVAGSHPPSHEFRPLNTIGNKSAEMEKNIPSANGVSQKVKSEPVIGNAINGVTPITIKGINNDKPRYIPNNLIDKYITEHTEAAFDER